MVLSHTGDDECGCVRRRNGTKGQNFAAANPRQIDAYHSESMSPTCSDRPHRIMKAQEVNDVIPERKWQVRAKDDLRGLTVVAALNLGAHCGHAAHHTGRLLPQRIDETITHVAAGTTQVKSLSIEFDVKLVASVPKSMSLSCCLFDIVSEDADVHFADVRHCVP